MKASMLEYENTISELRMNENIAQQKLEKLQGKTKEMEAQVKEAVESKKKLEDELNVIRSDNSERTEEEGRAKKELEDLKIKMRFLKRKSQTQKDLEAVKTAAADSKKVAILEREDAKAMEDRFEKERKDLNKKNSIKLEKLQRELKQAEETHVKVKEELATKHQQMEQQLQIITADLSREKDSVNALRTEIEQINASKGDVGKQVNELKHQLASMTTKLKEVTDNYQQYQDDTSKQFEAGEKAEKALVKKHQAELGKKQQELDSTRKRLEEHASSEIAKLQMEIDSLQVDSKANLEKTKKELMDRHEKDLKKQGQNLKAQFKKKTNEAKRAMTDELDKVKAIKQQLEDDLKVANTQLEEQTKGLNEAVTKEVKALESKSKEMQESLASSQQEVARLTKSLEDAAKKHKEENEERIRSLEAAHASTLEKHEKEIDALKESVKTANAAAKQMETKQADEAEQLQSKHKRKWSKQSKSMQMSLGN